MKFEVVNVKVKPLMILGTGVFAAEMVDIVMDTQEYKVDGFVENMDRNKCNERIEGLPVVWIDDIKDVIETHYFVCSIVTTHRIDYVNTVEKTGAKFATIIHPSAYISKTSLVGKGSVLSVGGIVASHTKIGNFVMINRGVTIGHDTIIGNCVTISPGVNIAGCCEIGDCSYIAIGSTIIDRIKIGKCSVVGAGAVVVKDVPDNVMVVGVPAKIVKENIDGK